jgi:hypothetical protein
MANGSGLTKVDQAPKSNVFEAHGRPIAVGRWCLAHLRLRGRRARRQLQGPDQLADDFHGLQPVTAVTQLRMCCLWLEFVRLCALVAALVACAPATADYSTGGLAVVTPFGGSDQGYRATLRGDPGFNLSGLPREQRALYDRFLAEVHDADNVREVMKRAASDDIFTYGRSLQGYVQSVLTVFRITGDLVLLDHVDAIAERMRQELRDGWRGTLDGTDGTRDGFLNWVERHESGSVHRGKDMMRANDMKTHALVAMIAYALELNRDLSSPSGRAYGAHADFWKDYLVNHFEAKWRKRRGVKFGFPIMIRPYTHTYYSWTKWHYYMWKLTGNDGYGVEANRMATALWKDIRTVSTPSGPAYVWPRGVLAEGGDADYLHPTGYANNVYGDAVTFHLEGFHNWAAVEHMNAIARTFTEFVIDTNDPNKNGFAPDIGGASPKGGYRVDPSWSRRTASAFVNDQFALFIPWDTTQELSRVTSQIQDRYPERDTTRLAAGLFLNSYLRPSTRVAAEAP